MYPEERLYNWLGLFSARTSLGAFQFIGAQEDPVQVARGEGELFLVPQGHRFGRQGEIGIDDLPTQGPDIVRRGGLGKILQDAVAERERRGVRAALIQERRGFQSGVRPRPRSGEALEPTPKSRDRLVPEGFRPGLVRQVPPQVENDGEALDPPVLGRFGFIRHEGGGLGHEAGRPDRGRSRLAAARRAIDDGVQIGFGERPAGEKVIGPALDEEIVEGGEHPEVDLVDEEKIPLFRETHPS